MADGTTPDDDDVSVWIRNLSGGDDEAFRKIFDRYFTKLVRLAKRKVDGLGINRRATGEEDIAQNAMYSFYKRASDGQFQLEDRGELWRLLVTITVRKAYAEAKSQRAQKRGGGTVRGESIFMKAGDLEPNVGIGQVLGAEPTAEFATLAAERCKELLDLLGDESQKDVARYKLDGYSNEEIAKMLNCVPRTVERKLQLIREKWSRAAMESEASGADEAEPEEVE